MSIPLWDRRFIPREGYEYDSYDFDHGDWKNIYLIPDEIYEKINDGNFVQEIRPEQLYTLEIAREKPLKLETNFHFITIEDCDHFSTDVGNRIGFTQCMIWWPRPRFGFHTFPRYIDWDDSDLPFVVGWTFTHYPIGSFAPLIPSIDYIFEKFNIDFDETFTTRFDRPDERFNETRFDIINWSLKMELERLQRYAFYKNLILNIIK